MWNEVHMFHLLDQLLELVLGDHTVAIHVKELESLRRQNLIFFPDCSFQLNPNQYVSETNSIWR